MTSIMSDVGALARSAGIWFSSSAISARASLTVALSCGGAEECPPAAVTVSRTVR